MKGKRSLRPVELVILAVTGGPIGFVAAFVLCYPLFN